MRRYFLCNQHQSNFIQFKDKEVEKLCVENFDNDNDGRISISDANKVTNIKTIFSGKTFNSFEDLYYFSNLTEIPKNAFLNTTILNNIILPYNCKIINMFSFYNFSAKTLIVKENIKYLNQNCFQSAKITNLIFYSKTPPNIYGYWEFIYNEIINFYVPDESLELYKTCPFAHYFNPEVFKPLSKYNGNI